jgi:hypothetical protein
LRVPYTFNSKYIEDGRNSEVKIIQDFDKSKPLPNIDNLLVEFVIFLTDRKLKIDFQNEKNSKKKVQSNNIQFSKPIISSNAITYVEKLLEMSLSDYRKYAINLILAPYFINILKLSDEESFSRIKEWTLKCNDVESLEPSIKDYDLIKNAIKRANLTEVKPLKFRETLQYKNKKLYEIILYSLKK